MVATPERIEPGKPQEKLSQGTAGQAAEGAAALPADVKQKLARSEKKMRKLQQAAQERIVWKATDQTLLGLSPRLWMEVFDKKHRYASLVYEYWRRWQLSDCDTDFWDWLNQGMGSLIDLPQAPRRLLSEWQVLYLTREQQSLFRVIIEPSTGRFLWEADHTPVTLPWLTAPTLGTTPREKAVAALLEERLATSTRRDDLLAAARREVESALAGGTQPTPERLAKIAAPLIKEGLVCQLRDPFFAERHDAASTPQGHVHHRSMTALPERLLPGIGWQDFLKAIAHDQGQEMRNPLATGDERLKGHGIFVMDSFGSLYCGAKIRGVLQHSSFVRGHCVEVAGGMVLKDGWLVQLSPHSGHYQPGQDTFEEMIHDWKESGVDFSRVHLKPFMK